MVSGMGFIELFMIAVGLSMDAFAVSMCKGLKMKNINYRHALVIGLYFGGFQALNPLVGWVLGRQFERYITEYDHWIAFGLLVIIGGKMLYEALTGDGDDDAACELLDLKELLMLAIATSIDALAVGITFAFLRVSIIPSMALIGATTFALSFIGVVAGNKFGSLYRRKAEIAGGIVLILIGGKILFEHLGIIQGR